MTSPRLRRSTKWSPGPCLRFCSTPNSGARTLCRWGDSMCAAAFSFFGSNKKPEHHLKSQCCPCRKFHPVHGEFVITLRLASGTDRGNGTASVVIKDCMGGRRFARSFSWSAATERLVNAIFVVINSEFFQLFPQVPVAHKAARAAPLVREFTNSPWTACRRRGLVASLQRFGRRARSQATVARSASELRRVDATILRGQRHRRR
jgi:hypothetical protein